MTSRILFFIAFMVFVTFMLALDLGVFHKKDHEIKIKEAAIWTGVWVTLAMLFGILLRFRAEWVHGIAGMEDLLAYAQKAGLQNLVQPSMEYAQALEAYRKLCYTYQTDQMNKVTHSSLYYTKSALSKVADDVSYFAKKEGLTAHAQSAVIRVKE